MGLPTRRHAKEHLNCNVSLEIYNDTCLCLQCNDCDVIIYNFGPAKIIDDDEPAAKPKCDIGVLVALSAFVPATASPSQDQLQEPACGPDEIEIDNTCEEFTIADDFGKKFYESDVGQIQEGNENEDNCENDGGGNAQCAPGQIHGRSDYERISERNSEAAGETCYFGKPADDIDSGSPSEPDEE